MERHHPITGARVGDEAFVRDRLPKARYSHGIPYVLAHRRDIGREATFLVTVRTRLEEINRAVLEVKQTYNVNDSVVLLVPETWLHVTTPAVA